MSCCGQRRAAVSAQLQGRGKGPSSPAATAKVPGPAVGIDSTVRDCLIRYVGTQPLSLRGPHSGRVYYFAETGNMAIVDASDIEPLLRTKLFVRDPGAQILETAT